MLFVTARNEAISCVTVQRFVDSNQSRNYDGSERVLSLDYKCVVFSWEDRERFCSSVMSVKDGTRHIIPGAKWPSPNVNQAVHSHTVLRRSNGAKINKNTCVSNEGLYCSDPSHYLTRHQSFDLSHGGLKPPGRSSDLNASTVHTRRAFFPHFFCCQILAPQRGRAGAPQQEAFHYFNEQSLQIHDIVLQIFPCLKS